ncbi:Translin-associated factorX-interacting protein 1 [Porites harrisoni]
MNDQLLPAPLDTEHEKLDEPWPGHAYTSHICRFDVFPRFDPERTKFGVSSQRKLKQQLLPSTEDALEKLSYSIYSTSVYQDTIKDSKHTPNQRGEACEVNVVSIPNKENTSLIEVEDWEVKDQEEIEGKTDNEEEQVEVSFNWCHPTARFFYK